MRNWTAAFGADESVRADPDSKIPIDNHTARRSYRPSIGVMACYSPLVVTHHPLTGSCRFAYCMGSLRVQHTSKGCQVWARPAGNLTYPALRTPGTLTRAVSPAFRRVLCWRSLAPVRSLIRRSLDTTGSGTSVHEMSNSTRVAAQGTR